MRTEISVPDQRPEATQLQPVNMPGTLSAFQRVGIADLASTKSVLNKVNEPLHYRYGLPLIFNHRNVHPDLSNKLGKTAGSVAFGHLGDDYVKVRSGYDYAVYYDAKKRPQYDAVLDAERLSEGSSAGIFLNTLKFVSKAKRLVGRLGVAALGTYGFFETAVNTYAIARQESDWADQSVLADAGLAVGSVGIAALWKIKNVAKAKSYEKYLDKISENKEGGAIIPREILGVPISEDIRQLITRFAELFDCECEYDKETGDFSVVDRAHKNKGFDFQIFSTSSIKDLQEGDLMIVDIDAIMLIDKVLHSKKEGSEKIWEDFMSDPVTQLSNSYCQLEPHQKQYKEYLRNVAQTKTKMPSVETTYVEETREFRQDVAKSVEYLLRSAILFGENDLAKKLVRQETNDARIVDNELKSISETWGNQLKILSPPKEVIEKALFPDLYAFICDQVLYGSLSKEMPQDDVDVLRLQFKRLAESTLPSAYYQYYVEQYKKLYPNMRHWRDLPIGLTGVAQVTDLELGELDEWAESQGHK